MACQIMMNFELKASELATFIGLLKNHLPDARTFDGCLAAQVIEDQDNKSNIVILESWDTRTQFEKYIAWRTQTGVLAQLVACCATDPTMRVFDGVDV